MTTAELDAAVPADSPVQPGPGMRAPLTFPCNRALASPRSRVAGTLRIALVGDSMTYGAGLPYRRSLAARLAAHVNGDVPAVWAECLGFGVPGGCLYHAAGRVVTQALPLQPDIVVLCVCRNDARLLGFETERLEELGQQWVSARALIRSALVSFRSVAARESVRALVVYHDGFRHSADVCIPDELGATCAEVGLPFLDGSAALSGYPSRELWVSAADRHLNALGTDIVARQIAKFLSSHGWTPPSGGFADGAWIDLVERVARAHVEAGLAPALVFGEALAVLDGKWRHRRNTARGALTPIYAASRQRMLDAQTASVTRLAAAIGARWLRMQHPLVRLTMVEQWANDAMAMSFALGHLLGDGPRNPIDTQDLAARAFPAGTGDAGVLRARLSRVRETSHRVRQTLESATAGGDADHDSPDLQFFLFWASRVAQWCYTVECVASRYLELLPRAAASTAPAVAEIVRYVDGIAQAVEDVLNVLCSAVEWIPAAWAVAARAAGAGWPTLELAVAAPPGAEIWGFNIGIESVAPGYTERHVGCGNLIRDGRPHAFELDIPPLIAGAIHVRLHGAGIGVHRRDVRIHSARLRWPQGALPDLALPQVILESVDADSIVLVFPDVRTLPVPV